MKTLLELPILLKPIDQMHEDELFELSNELARHSRRSARVRKLIDQISRRLGNLPNLKRARYCASLEARAGLLAGMNG